MVNEQLEESLMSKLVRTGMTSMATAGIGSAIAAPGLDHALAGSGTDVTGLNGAQIGDGSILHHGPVEGGAVLDRPSAGYLAHSSAESGVELERMSGGSMSNIARSVDDAGRFSLEGTSFDVMDYLPGGDMVQIAAGRADPGQIMTSFAQKGMELGMESQTPSTHVGATPGRTPPSVGATDQGASRGFDETPASRGGQAEGGAGTGEPGAEATASDKGKPERMINGQHIPDADENQRDLDALLLEHGRNLDTAVEGFDQSVVHTELHAHGRTLAIDTEYEATAKSNTAERAEAGEHLSEALHAGRDEVASDAPDMHFRSKVHAFLDQQSRDQGMSI